MVLVRCFFIILFAVFLGSCERLKTSVRPTLKDEQTKYSGVYLAVYQLPTRYPNSLANLAAFFPNHDSLPFEEERTKEQIFIDEINTFNFVSCSAEQIKSLTPYLEKDGINAHQKRFYDISSPLKKIYGEDDYFWAVYDIEKSQLYLQCKPHQHKYVLKDYNRYHLAMVHIRNRISIQSSNALNHSPEIKPKTILFTDAFFRPGEDGEVIITSKKSAISFQYKSTSYLLDPECTSINQEIDYTFKFSDFSATSGFLHNFAPFEELTQILGRSTISGTEYLARSTAYTTKNLIQKPLCTHPPMKFPSHQVDEKPNIPYLTVKKPNRLTLKIFKITKPISPSSATFTHPIHSITHEIQGKHHEYRYKYSDLNIEVDYFAEAFLDTQKTNGDLYHVFSLELEDADYELYFRNISLCLTHMRKPHLLCEINGTRYYGLVELK